MKSFKDYLREQVVGEGDTTSDPDFIEKKKKKDSQIAAKDTSRTMSMTPKTGAPAQERSKGAGE